MCFASFISSSPFFVTIPADYVKNHLNSSYEEARQQKKKLSEAKNAAEEKLRDIVLATVGKSLDATERRIYEQEKAHYESVIDSCRADIEKLDKCSALKSFDYDEFSNFLESAADSWKVAYGESLHQMAKFLFSNFTVRDRKVVNLAFNSEIEDLFIPFVPNGGVILCKSEPHFSVGEAAADFAAHSRSRRAADFVMMCNCSFAALWPKQCD